MIKSKITTIANDQKLKDLLRNAKQGKGAHVSVGIQEGAANYPNGESVVEVAAWNEYGTETIPSRPFINPLRYGKEGEINSVKQQVVRDVIAGRTDVLTGLERIGQRIQNIIENRIKSSVPPPNALSTQRKKALKGTLPKKLKGARVGLDVGLLKSRTLIDTGHLLANIAFKVFKK